MRWSPRWSRTRAVSFLPLRGGWYRAAGIGATGVGQAEESLAIGREHVAGVTGREAAGGDVADGALVGGAVVVREISAEDEAVGAERIGGAAQRGRVSMADGVVPHPAGGQRRPFRGIGCLP